ncbi:hypothetical protein [Bacillus licheniformis]|nr:hypothetical protein [Bacillus licheniformis]
MNIRMKILNFFLIAGVCFLFSGCHSVEKTESQKKETASPSSDERYNDEQEGITGPGTETVSYGL